MGIYMPTYKVTEGYSNEVYSIKYRQNIDKEDVIDGNVQVNMIGNDEMISCDKQPEILVCVIEERNIQAFNNQFTELIDNFMLP